MNCPACKKPKSIVYDSRNSSDGVRRYRKCDSCDHHWATVETVVQPRKKGGNRFVEEGAMDLDVLNELRQQKKRADLVDDEDDDSISPD